ncbi:lipopolysaccharide biosynthesis protein [Roseibium sp.]|uniref:lipopolysaccharide biosynthesis protein n=1 Tax=Roseibium sp. TaxID=1936156 RepID=UPI0032972FF2
MRSMVARSIGWSALQIVGNHGMSFIVFVILTRLLTPAEIGVVAIALAITEVGSSLTRAGLMEALVRAENADDEQQSTCFWFTLSSGTLFALVAAALAGGIAELFDASVLAYVVPVLALTVPLSALSATHEARLIRRFDFRSLAVRGFLGTVAGGLVGVWMAMQGYGVWSLVAQRAAVLFVSMALVWRADPWLPALNASASALRDLLSQGIPIGLVTFLYAMNYRLFEIVLGLFFGPAVVGYLKTATRTLDVAFQFAIGPFTSVALPTFSRLQGEPEALKRAVMSFFHISGMIALPILVSVGILASDLIPIALGQRWSKSGELLAILSCTALPLLMQSVAFPTLQATGRSVLSVYAYTFSLVAGLLLAVIAAPYGVSAVAFSMVLKSLLMVPILSWLINRYVGIDLRTQLAAVRLPLVTSLILGFCLLGALHAYPVNNALPRLVGLAAFSLFVYGVIIAVIYRGQLGARLRLTFARAKAYLGGSE